MQMQSIVPPSRPKMKRKELLKLISNAYPDASIPDICVVGIRGYYLNTLGEHGLNDIGIYDDAIFILTEKEIFAFNANTDPSKHHLAIATLKPGVWPVYKFAMHRGQYLALCQRAGNLTVSRFEKGDDTGSFGINIHKGGSWKTGSLGCQTIVPSQWDEFITTMQTKAREINGSFYKDKVYTYILLENPEAVADQKP